MGADSKKKYLDIQIIQKSDFVINKDLFSHSQSLSQSPIECNGKSIFLPKLFGFCGGVTSALKTLERAISENKDTQIFLLGDIIHNETVSDHFRNAGVKIVPHPQLNNIFKLATPDNVIVIPAFGIPVDLEEKIRACYPKVIDTTCKDVKKIWEFIKKESSCGNTIIMHGHTYHPEVEASLSHCAKKSAIFTVRDYLATKALLEAFCHWSNSMVSCLVQRGIRIENPEKINLNTISLANQTTMLYDETLEISEEISRFCDAKGYKFNSCRTVCMATFNRQNAAEALLKTVKLDLVIVVGGYNSSNTRQLYKIAKKNCNNVIHIKDQSSINVDGLIENYNPCLHAVEFLPVTVIKKSKNIAVLAGASCPVSVVSETIETLKIVSCT